MTDKSLKELITQISDWIAFPKIKGNNLVLDQGTTDAPDIVFSNNDVEMGRIFDIDGNMTLRSNKSVTVNKDNRFIGDYTSRARQVNSSLTTSSTDDAWLTAVLKAICQDYPNISGTVFHGRVSPNSAGFFQVYIYDTGKVSGGMPQYCNGFLRKWQNRFWIFSTNNYAFSYVQLSA